MPRKQRNKYRYFWDYHVSKLIRFPSSALPDDRTGNWLFETWSDTHSLHPMKTFINDNQEVTLSQGLHYKEGNYVE